MEKKYLKLGENMYVEVPSTILSGISVNNCLIYDDEESGEFEVLVNQTFIDKTSHWVGELRARESREEVIDEIIQSFI